MNKAGLGECQRCGDVVNHRRLMKDGQYRGLIVCRDCYDPRHPQDVPYNVKPEKHHIPAPELSKPPGEGEAAPELTFDELGRLVS